MLMIRLFCLFLLVFTVLSENYRRNTKKEQVHSYINSFRRLQVNTQQEYENSAQSLKTNTTDVKLKKRPKVKIESKYLTEGKLNTDFANKHKTPTFDTGFHKLDSKTLKTSRLHRRNNENIDYVKENRKHNAKKTSKKHYNNKTLKNNPKTRKSTNLNHNVSKNNPNLIDPKNDTVQTYLSNVHRQKHDEFRQNRIRNMQIKENNFAKKLQRGNSYESKTDVRHRHRVRYTTQDNLINGRSKKGPITEQCKAFRKMKKERAQGLHESLSEDDSSEYGSREYTDWELQNLKKSRIKKVNSKKEHNSRMCVLNAVNEYCIAQEIVPKKKQSSYKTTRLKQKSKSRKQSNAG